MDGSRFTFSRDRRRRSATKEQTTRASFRQGKLYRFPDEIAWRTRSVQYKVLNNVFTNNQEHIFTS